ncbi:MAG: protein kinase [Bacteroidota bacterium]
MSAPDWSRLKPIFDAAQCLAETERALFLDDACAGDAVLRAEVERLLELANESEGFFETLESAILRPEAAEASLPERVGPWRILREIGQGGMGRVLLAERTDDAFEQRVAIKIVETGAPGLVRRFRRERRILASLDHPHVARLLDGGELADGRPYLVMEYVEGVSITEYATPLRIDARLELFVQVCDVVAYAHRQLVVHRDLKPSNILVREDSSGRPIVKLLDFGIARLLEDAEGFELTRTGQRLHTPVYAAPEQLRGIPVTTSTDVYALGVLLYELLTRRRPYGAEERDRRQLEAAILEGVPTAPSGVAEEPGLRRRLRGDLDRIVLKALRKEPERRYGSVDALARDVERHRAGLPVEARRATLGYRLRSFVQRHTGGVAMTTVAVLLALAVGGLYTLRVTAERNRAEAAAARAEQISEVLTDVLAQAESATTDASLLLRILEPAVARADSELADDPDTRAAVLFTLGRLHHRIGSTSQADSLLRASLAIRRNLHQGPHEDITASLYALGERFISQPDSARVYFQASAEMRSRLSTADPVNLGWSLLQWDRMLPKDHPEKGDRYQEVLALFRRHTGARSVDIAEAIHEYHVHGYAAGAPEEYAAAFAEVLDIYLENGLERDPRTIGAMYNLGLEYEKMGAFDEAFPLFRQAIRLAREVLPPGMSMVTTMSTNYGATLHEQGQLVEADSVLRSVAEKTRSLLPAEANAIGHSHYWYGRNLLALGRPEDAVPVLETAVRNYTARSEAGFGYQRSCLELGAALAALGRYAEAEKLLTDSIDEVEDARYVARGLERLIELYQATAQGQLAAAYEARLNALAASRP